MAAGDGAGFWLSGFAPLTDPAWALAGPAGRLAYWRKAAAVGRLVYAEERAKRLDVDGRELARLSPVTIAHRRSAMGKATPNAPQFTPAGARSRVLSYLTAEATEAGVWYSWRRDFGEILQYHALGLVPGAPARNVMGFSPKGRKRIAGRMRTWWKANRLALVKAAGGGAQPVAAEAAGGGLAVRLPADLVGAKVPKAAEAKPFGTPGTRRVAHGPFTHADLLNELQPSASGPAAYMTDWGAFVAAPAQPPPSAPRPPQRPAGPLPAAVSRPKPIKPDPLPVLPRRDPLLGHATPSNDGPDYIPEPPEHWPKPPKPKKPPAPRKPRETWPADPDALEVVRQLGGSTGAELVKDKAGKLYVRKRGGNADHLREETHADALYRAAGLDVPKFKRFDLPGGPVKLSRFEPDAVTLRELVTTDPAAHDRAVAELRKGFAVDALLGNWDVVGVQLDNVLVTKAGKVLRVDNGGSLRFRAQGAKKSASQWSKAVGELNSLRDPGINPSAAAVFKGLTDDEIKSQVKALWKKRAAILKAAPDDLKATLQERLEWMRDWATAKPPKLGKFRPTPADQFRAFSDPAEMTEWSKKHYAAWAKNLTDDQVAALRYYTGSGYSRLNAWLRGTGSADPNFEQVRDNLDAALAAARSPEGIVGYRGMSLSAVGLSRHTLQPGMVIPDEGYTSTSLSRSGSFSGDKFEVRIPKGLSGVFVNAAKSRGGSQHPSELEFLLGRDVCKFVVVEVKPDIIVVEAVPCKADRKAGP